MKNLLVLGGSGALGSSFVKRFSSVYKVFNVDLVENSYAHENLIINEGNNLEENYKQINSQLGINFSIKLF